jgi:hypothetical protein
MSLVKSRTDAHPTSTSPGVRLYPAPYRGAFCFLFEPEPRPGSEGSSSTLRRQTEDTMATTVDSRRETVSLIGSDKVDGTAVYGADDRKIGSVQRVMIDKISGKVAYAVISFGGFLGMGEDYYPLPWSNLKYDTNLGGYRVGITEDQLKGAPKYTRSTEWDWSDRARDREVYDYYRTPLWY